MDCWNHESHEFREVLAKCSDEELYGNLDRGLDRGLDYGPKSVRLYDARMHALLALIYTMCTYSLV